MHVGELGATFVDGFAQRGIGLIGGAETDGIGLGESAVERFAGGGAGQDADFKGFAFGVESLGACGDGPGGVFGGASGGEPAEGDRLGVVD